MEEEVTISSDSAPLPRQKLRLVTRKVRFSHPLAYLDPHFLLKKQQHESRRQARNDDEPPSVLQQTPQKRQNEVSFIVIFYFPLMDLLLAFLTFFYFCRRCLALLATRLRLNFRPLRLPLGKEKIIFPLCLSNCIFILTVS